MLWRENAEAAKRFCQITANQRGFFHSIRDAAATLYIAPEIANCPHGLVRVAQHSARDSAVAPPCYTAGLGNRDLMV